MKIQETICKCDICGKEMRESETGHGQWPCYLVLGYNMNEFDTKRYDDVCDECTVAISAVIDQRKNKKRNESDVFGVFEKKISK